MPHSAKALRMKEQAGLMYVLFVMLSICEQSPSFVEGDFFVQIKLRCGGGVEWIVIPNPVGK
ncbi:hypothetical protein [Bacillus sp. FJAT-45350]|uniref:hypothetical protein n=1 Tax=Bacillus sp. FJAT-45350 TaxID=2011014 RepID=UPI000BB8E640|nr:hypothetical protein [Bacillus sp. FJAT-45350]